MSTDNTSNGTCDSGSYEQIKEIADFLLAKTKYRPKLGIVCGSGLGHLANSLENADAFNYKDIPNFPVSTVVGHAGRLVFGTLNGVSVVCMQGRFHAYEGYPLWKCVLPIRTMKLMGVKTLFLTNAAGGLNEKYSVGDIMIIKDHINFLGFAGDNPLKGKNDERWGPRFPPMNKAYDAKIRTMAKETAKDLGYSDIIQEGVYVMLGGPSFETIAEIRALRILGADAVGMSTAHEAITAKHCGMTVFGMSLITNKGIMDYESTDEPNHIEVLETSERRKPDLLKLVSELIRKVGAQST